MIGFPKRCSLGNKNEESSHRPDRRRKSKISGILGIGLDGDDGHTRITRGKNFVLWGEVKTPTR